MKIRIAIADDHDLVRGGLVAIVGLEPDMEVVAEAADGAAAVEQYLRWRPDVLLLDLHMPVMGGLEAATAIRQAVPEARILIVSLRRQAEEIAAALAAGVCGYVDKDNARSQLARAIRTVHAGFPYVRVGMR